MSRETLAAETEILQRADLLEKLQLPRAIRKILQRNLGKPQFCPSLRVMRFDFHPTKNGWMVSEVNSDVPGGFIEASGWNKLCSERWRSAAIVSTSDIYADEIYKNVDKSALVALVHATNFSDDRQVMQQLGRCLEKRGLRTALLGPENVRWTNGYADIEAAFAEGRADAVVRFFPAEWLPKAGPKSSWYGYFQPANIPVSNPAFALVSQTKRFPVVWDDLEAKLSTWRKMLPRTCAIRELRWPLDDSWVLKPVLGRVGEGIAIHGVSTTEEQRCAEWKARWHPAEWVAQERFVISPVDTESGTRYPCIGVFTINGNAAGFYGRVSKNPIITHQAQDVAVLVRKKEEVNAA